MRFSAHTCILPYITVALIVLIIDNMLTASALPYGTVAYSSGAESLDIGFSVTYFCMVFSVFKPLICI